MLRATRQSSKRQCSERQSSEPLSVRVLRQACATSVLLLACSGSGVEPASNSAGGSATSAPASAQPSPSSVVGNSAAGNGAAGAGQAPSAADAAASSPEPAVSTSVGPLRPAGVLFQDPDSSFATADVYDADREVVRFDAERQAMVSATTGDGVAGWTTTGNDLRWQQSSVAFRVRFGTEGGARRAYFTEAGNGTLCNLQLSGPDRLSIFGTSQLPPE